MNGQVDLDTVLIPTPENETKRKEILRFDAATRRKMSAKGKLGLPKLLDQRRIDYGITDGAFRVAMSFDRVLIYQIPEHQGETFMEGGAIVMPDQARDRIKHECPRGILIGAGARALDQLRSNGIDLGHIVWFINSQPWRLYFDFIEGKRISALPMNCGDIIGSEDLQQGLRDGKVKIVSKENEHGVTEHMFVDEEGKAWSPQIPWSGADSI